MKSVRTGIARQPKTISEDQTPNQTMKTTLKKSIVGAIALALVAPFAIAEPGEGGGKGKRGEGKGPRGDRPDRPSREEMIKKFDADGDGKLNTEERVKMLKEGMEKNPRMKEGMLKRHDANKDGTLDDAELKAAAEAMGKRRGGGGKGGPGEGKGSRGGEGGKGKGRPDAE